MAASEAPVGADATVAVDAHLEPAAAPSPGGTLRRSRTELPWCDPVDAYERLRDVAPVLLCGGGAHPDAGRAYLALSPAWKASCHGGAWRVEGDGPAAGSAREAVATPDPLEALRRLCDTMRHEVPDPGFTGGIVGYFGYGFVSAVEPTLPAQDASTPDAVLWLCRDTIAFDLVRRRAELWCTDLPGEAEAGARARNIQTTLRAPQVEPGPLAAAVGTADAGHGWEASMQEAAFCAAVERVRRLVHEGDLFQANIATRFHAPCRMDPPQILRHLLRDNPSPYMALIDAGDHQVVSCSPELLLKVEAGTVSTRPIAGTRRRGRTPEDDAAMERELLGDPKEQAEHTMLVDLLRNDVAKVAVPGTVHVPERMSVERYRHVMHLVSRVEAQVRPGTGFVDWLAALFPGGTITGAPKHRACLRIAETEPVARGPYTGSAGYLGWNHDAQWNILIRTLVLNDGQAFVHAGSGIVADSDPRREWREAQRKAQALLDVATGGGAAGGDRLGEVTRHGAWAPTQPRRVQGRRVLIIDNYDSFTHNLADQVAAMGATVEVVRNDADWRGAWRRLRPTHAVLSPGPGRPDDSAATLELLAQQAAEGQGADGDVPVLGVCLGHQAMGWSTGATIVQVPPVHGRPDAIRHDGAGLFEALPSPLMATRYHSLAVTDLPPEWRAVAWAADGTVMAMVHRRRPWWGLQFHPESLCTDMGVEIVTRFLELEHGRHRVG